MGSLVVNTSIKGKDHGEAPFAVDLPEPRKAFVHVFDEVSVELVMQELDTAVDFLDYLKARENLLGRPESTVIAPGEEELLAAYLSTMDEAEDRHTFLNAPLEAGNGALVMFDGTHHAGLRRVGVKKHRAPLAGEVHHAIFTSDVAGIGSTTLEDVPAEEVVKLFGPLADELHRFIKERPHRSRLAAELTAK